MSEMTANDKAIALKRVAKLWLVVTALLAVLWLLIWIGTDEAEEVKAIGSKEAPETVSDLTLPKTIDKFKDFEGEIPDISFETIKRDLRNYPNEFKDREFFEKNKDKWTVEVMDVSEHQIITDYLERRKDREKFVYFRYMDSKSKERYVLLYDVMNNRQLAIGATKLINFDLPNNARTLPASFSEYLDKIDNYTRSDVVEEKKAPVLKETKKEVKPLPLSEKPKPKPQPKEEHKEEPKPERKEKPKEEAPKETPPQTPELAVPPTATPTPEAVPTPTPPPAPVPAENPVAEGGNGEQGDSQ